MTEGSEGHAEPHIADAAATLSEWAKLDDVLTTDVPRGFRAAVSQGEFFPQKQLSAWGVGWGSLVAC
jgi:hypothetical protein